MAWEISGRTLNKGRKKIPAGQKWQKSVGQTRGQSRIEQDAGQNRRKRPVRPAPEKEKSKTRVRIVENGQSDPRRKRRRARRGSEVAKQANQTRGRSKLKQDAGQNHQNRPVRPAPEKEKRKRRVRSGQTSSSDPWAEQNKARRGSESSKSASQTRGRSRIGQKAGQKWPNKLIRPAPCPALYLTDGSQ